MRLFHSELWLNTFQAEGKINYFISHHRSRLTSPRWSVNNSKTVFAVTMATADNKGCTWCRYHKITIATAARCHGGGLQGLILTSVNMPRRHFENAFTCYWVSYPVQIRFRIKCVYITNIPIDCILTNRLQAYWKLPWKQSLHGAREGGKDISVSEPLTFILFCFFYMNMHEYHFLWKCCL